jgi:hypothetical protein
MPDDSELDGCALDMADEDQLTEDGEQQDALVLFAARWDDPDAVQAQRTALIEWAAAQHPETDTEPTTGAP